jgi:hypothetical protein
LLDVLFSQRFERALDVCNVGFFRMTATMTASDDAIRLSAPQQRDDRRSQSLSQPTLLSLQRRTMRTLVLTLCFLLAVACSVVTASKEVLFDFQAGPSKTLGLFFAGHQHQADNDAETDVYVGTLEPLAHNTQRSALDSAFVVRSQDFTSLRVKVTVWENTDDETKGTFPILLTIKNLVADQGAVELRHAEKGFQWIETASVVTHNSAYEHPFEIRDNESNVLLTIRVFSVGEDEL